MSWQHIRPASLPWRRLTPALDERLLTSIPFPVRSQRLAPATSITWQGLGLIESGSGLLDAQTALATGDLVWRRDEAPLQAGPEGLTWWVFDLPVELRPAPAQLTIGVDHVPWQAFADPAGRPTQPVQVLLDGSLSALRTRFVPEYEAGEHWHDYDTLYFIMAGDMQFGFEGQYYTGDVRQVSGGFSYGPEKPGPQGVEFVLFSCGGPVNLHWSDRETPPRGRLQPLSPGA